MNEIEEYLLMKKKNICEGEMRMFIKRLLCFHCFHFKYYSRGVMVIFECCKCGKERGYLSRLEIVEQYHRE